MKSYFYIITNIVNNKTYYGSGSKKNYFGSGTALRSAISKYGKENFIMTILREFETRKEAFAFEDRFLKLYKVSSLHNTYNLKDSSEGGNTWSHLSTDESDLRKDVLRNKLKGRIRSNEHCNNISKAKLGIKFKNTINMSICKQGNKNHMYEQGHKVAGGKNGQFGKTGSDSPRFGKPHTEETINLMKDKARKGPRTISERENMSKGIEKSLSYYIEQIKRDTGELVETHPSVMAASKKTNIKYYKVYSNLDKTFAFNRVQKDVNNLE
jgi:hypothetical protein